MNLIDLAKALGNGKAKKAALAKHARDVYTENELLREIGHYVYGGDTLLHVAAAIYDVAALEILLAAGANPMHTNRRGAIPLHYACDGVPGGPRWDPEAQAATVSALVAAGADPNFADKSHVVPLWRAVRTRSTGAVRALLAAGVKADAKARRLASSTTGRGGSGSAAAKEEQLAIQKLLAGR
jgi:hypothetical protein